MSQTPATIDPVTALRIESAQLSLHSVFQPIVSIAHSRVVGHEALLRGRSDAGMPLSPAELFPRLAGHLTHTAVNESCSRLHLTSFSKRNRGGWLFLNVSPAAMADRDTVSPEFGSWLKDSGVQPHQVVVEIIDNGAGIPPNIRERLFDPFVTTSEGGTGLGLSIAARIVEKHGGELRHEPTRGGGTTFIMVLPAGSTT